MEKTTVQENGEIVEVHPSEIEKIEICGRGSFGIVEKALWRNNVVAVKTIYGDQSKQSFETELKQLSRLNHPNIVKLFGASTRVQDNVFLVMEYAEGGSLYDVLHGTNGTHVSYTLTHAISWALQCAKGIAYLHSLKPKPIVHRDLKTPNLLLFDKGAVVKICDLGFACDLKSIMSVTRGTFAWMAPEVFQSPRYTEKCDVYSWAVVFWHILSRKKPYEELSHYQIMWGVHNGLRPPLLKNCPKPIEKLITQCWDKNPEVRPPIAEVEILMTEIFKICERKGMAPLTFTKLPADQHQASQFAVEDSQSSQMEFSDYGTKEDGVFSYGFNGFAHTSRNYPQVPFMGYSQNLKSGQTKYHNSPNPAPELLSHLRFPGLETREGIRINQRGEESQRLIGKNQHRRGEQGYIDPALLPIDPDPNSPESMRIYREHQLACKSYYRKLVEVQLLDEEKRQLEASLRNGSSTSTYDELQRLENDRAALAEFKSNLETQVNLIRNGAPDFSGLDDFVIVEKLYP